MFTLEEDLPQQFLEQFRILGTRSRDPDGSDSNITVTPYLVMLGWWSRTNEQTDVVHTTMSSLVLTIKLN